MKRGFALLLCFCMVIQLCPMQSLADFADLADLTDAATAESTSTEAASTVLPTETPDLPTEEEENEARTPDDAGETSDRDAGEIASQTLASVSDAAPLLETKGESEQSGNSDNTGTTENTDESGDNTGTTGDAADTGAVTGGTGMRVYLSDIPTSKMPKCSVGWSSYTINKNFDGNKIQLKVNNSTQYFDRGIAAHAAADLIYDLGESHSYDYFDSWIGVDASRNGNGTVQFYFYVADDCKNDAGIITDVSSWTEVFPYHADNTSTLVWDGSNRKIYKGNTEADHVKVSLFRDDTTAATDTTEGAEATTEGTETATTTRHYYRYFRIVCNVVENNAADHSVFGDAMFTSANYKVPTLTGVLQKADSYLTQVGLDVSSITGNVSDPDATGDAKTQYDNNLAVFTGNLGTVDKTSVSNSISDTELALLRYQLVNSCGYDNLYTFLTTTADYQKRINAYQWLINNKVALQEFMNGGAPANGSYISALDVLSDLYAAHSNDLNDTGKLMEPDTEHTNDTRGDLYRRMMLTMSLVCAGGLNSWMWPYQAANPVERYEYFKMNYLSSEVGVDGMRAEIFENLNVDEMRWVLGNNISDAEVVWLNDYAWATPRYGTQTSFPIIYSPHHHISYRWYDYTKAQFYSKENEEAYTTKYMLISKTENNDTETTYADQGLIYGSTNASGQKLQWLWMVFEDGAVCGNISRTGANLAACFGVPACEVGQPGHAAFLIMGKSGESMTWGIDNNISGWMQSCNSRRMPCGWGVDSDDYKTDYWRVSYILLAQAALNDLPHYTKAEEVLMMYDLCTTADQKEACCRAALSYMSYHLDAWEKLVKLYCDPANGKTAAQLADLAEELCSASNKLCYYPKPMVELMQLITNRISAISASYNPVDSEEATAAAAGASSKADAEVQLSRAKMALNAGLVAASKATSEDTVQYSDCRSIANYYLNSGAYSLATFSFDGDNANQLVFSSDFSSVRFRYCVGTKTEQQQKTDEDGNPVYTTDENSAQVAVMEDVSVPVWSDDIYISAADVGTEGSKVTKTSDGRLTYDLSDVLSQINYTDDIYIWLVGWAGDPNLEGAFKIDILQGGTVTGIEFNDNENRFFGTVTNLQYTTDSPDSESGADNRTWADLTNDTVIEGTHTITVRKKASGTTMLGAETSFSCTQDNTTNRKYIPISRMSVYAYSSEESSHNDYAKYVIDGTSTTRWHTLWNGTDQDKYIILKTDEPCYFTGLSYLPNGGSSGNGNIKKAVIDVSMDAKSWMTAANVDWPDSSAGKSVTFEPVYGQYVRIRVTDSHGGFVNAAKLELYENVTLKNKTLSGIQLMTLPAKLNYVRGEKLDLTGATARLVYTDNTHSTLPVAMLTPSTSVLDTVGDNQTIKLTYGTHTASFRVNVTERSFTPTSIRVETVPYQTTLYAGDDFLTDGIVVTATDGSTTVYLTPEEFTLTGDNGTLGEQTVTVTMNGTTLTDTYTVTVKQAIQSIRITSMPDTVFYDLGQAFDSTGLKVEAVREVDGQEVTEELSSTDYTLKGIDGFSNKFGNPTITVALADKASVSTDFTVTVYPYFTIYSDEEAGKGIRYAAETDGTCKVAAFLGDYTNTPFVSVPQTVQFSTMTYTVNGVASNALDNVTGVTSLALPGTVQSLAEHALDGGTTPLSKLYLTAHTSFNDISIAETALNTDVEIILYAPNEALEKALNTRLQETLGAAAAANMTVDDVKTLIASITVTPPATTRISVGTKAENVNWTGYAVTAVLTDDTRVPLDAGTCTLDTSLLKLDTIGTYTITVTLTEDSQKDADKQRKDTFTLEVVESKLQFTEHPQGSVTFTAQDSIPALTVSASASDVQGAEIVYTWYRSADGTIDHGADQLKNADDTAITGSTYQPKVTGYYYAGATVKGTGYTVYSMIAEVDIGDYAVLTGTKDANGAITWHKGYDTLAAAVSSSASGNYVRLLKDITLYETVAIARSGITLDGNGHTVKRGSGLSKYMFTTSGVTVSMDNITLDGGADWHGDSSKDNNAYTEDLQRYWLGTTSNGPIIKAMGASKLTFSSTVTLCNNYNMCQATRDATGGAIYAEGTTQLTLNGTRILDCYSDLFGSAIYFRDSSSLTINNGCEIKGCSGGTKYNTSVLCADNSANLTINGGRFHHNAGNNAGGVLWVCDGTICINGGVMENNKANKGSSIFVKSGSRATINLGGTFTMKDVYLADSTKTVNIVSDITGSSVNIVTTAAYGSTPVVLSNGVSERTTASVLTINGMVPGIKDGSITVPCSDSNHTKAVDSEGNALTREKSSADCTHDQLVYEYCSVCGAQIGELLTGDKATGHTEVPIEKVDATCTQNGHTGGTECSTCRQVLTEPTVISALGHEYEEEVTKEATCITEGEATYTCTREGCGVSYTETLPILGHDYVYNGKVVCSRCKDEYDGTLPTDQLQQMAAVDGFELSVPNDLKTSLSPGAENAKVSAVTTGNTAVNGFYSTGLKSMAATRESSLTAIRTALKASIESDTKLDASAIDSVTGDQLSLYVKVTTRSAEVAKLNLGETEADSTTAKTTTVVSRASFDVTPYASALVPYTTGSDVDALVAAAVPAEAITGPIYFRLPVDSDVPAGRQVNVWHQAYSTSDKTYFGSFKVQESSNSKYIELSSQFFSIFTYEIVEDGYELKGLARNLTISDSLAINYKVSFQGYTDPVMVFEFWDDLQQAYVTTEVSSYTNGTYNDGTDTISCQVFTFSGVYPQRMMDNLKATLYAKNAKGETVSITFSDYSIKDYLVNMVSRLNATKDDGSYRYFTSDVRAKHCKLFAWLIAYGAEAQESQNYEKANLISTVFENMKDSPYAAAAADTNYASQYMADKTSVSVDTTSTCTKQEGGVTLKSVSLVLSGTVGVRIKFTLADDISLEDVKFQVSVAGRSASSTFTSENFEDLGDGVYSLVFRGIKATEMNKQITFQAMVLPDGLSIAGSDADAGDNEAAFSTEVKTSIPEDDKLVYTVNCYLTSHFNDEANGLIPGGGFFRALFNYGCAAQNFIQ